MSEYRKIITELNTKEDSPAVYEYIPKGKKNGTVCVYKMDATDKGTTNGDKIVAWKYMDCTKKLYTLTYRNEKWY
jgi:hypothetical protein